MNCVILIKAVCVNISPKTFTIFYATYVIKGGNKMSLSIKRRRSQTLTNMRTKKHPLAKLLCKIGHWEFNCLHYDL